MLSLRHRPNIFSGGLEGRRSAGYHHFSNASFPVKPVSRQVISFNGHLAITFSTAEELIFVFPSTRLSVACRFTVLSTALLAFAGLGSSAVAQTAPQLLPYTSKLIAGGVTGATFTVGATCPQAGAPNTAKDTYGDGCFANEISLTAPRYAIADTAGNVFISDYTNGLVRRVDAITGIITAVAGGATSSPGKNVACGTNTSVDILGDGCLGTAVKLGKPAGLAFDGNGDLIFADAYNYNIRMIAATGHLVPATGGVISLVAGTNGGTTSTGGFTSGVVAATSSYVEDVYGISFDTSGNLYYADEYTKAEAVSVINTNAPSAPSDVVTGITVPAGQTVKIAGATAGGGPCLNYPTTGFGCTYGTFKNNTSALATVTQLDAPYAVASDNHGNVFIANEFENSVAKVNAAGILTLYAGTNAGLGVNTLPNTTRAPATTVAMGTDFGIAADSSSNIYVTDAYLGYIWRVDAATGYMYVVAGGGSGSCTSPNSLDTPQSYDTADTYGDGCPGLQAKLGIGSGTSGYTSSGVFGITVDANTDLFFGDSVTNLVREIASGTQFGVVGANQPVNTLDVHFGAGDTPAATGAFTLIAGATNFSLGTPACTYNNADLTTDCLLPVTATPTVLGAFAGTLQVAATKGGTAMFYLNGTYAQSPITRTSLTASAPSVSCSGSKVYPTTAPIILTATLAANGPSAPTGTIIFYSNGTALAPTTGVAVSNIGTTSSPVYGATLTETFPTAASYSITATYVPPAGGYFVGSTSAAAKFSTSLPTFTTSVNTSVQQSTIIPGQTALYSFNVAQNVYSGTITFSCSGLPTGAACVFSPSSITASGCSTTSVVALSITTQQPLAATSGSFGGTGHGRWQMVGVLVGFTMALLIGIRRRKYGMRYGQIWMVLALLLAASGAVACGTGSVAGTPLGTSTVTVKAAGTDGTVTTFTVPLVIN